MARMNIHLDDKRNDKLHKLKEKFNINSKEETIMRLIDQFPLEEDNSFDITKEMDMGDLL